MRKPITRIRNNAFYRQNGLCFYCEFPMWITDLFLFARMRSISAEQAKRFQCTAEHLVPRSSGGRDTDNNVVAACFYCNTHRHRLKQIPTPSEFKRYVGKRIIKGRWHTPRQSVKLRRDDFNVN